MAFPGAPYELTAGRFMIVVDLGHRWPKSTTMMNAGAGGGGERWQAAVRLAGSSKWSL